jgi:hypothetical protein
MGEETDPTRPKLSWSAIGYLAPQTETAVTFRVRANGRDVLNNGKNVEWFYGSMVILELDL